MRLKIVKPGIGKGRGTLCMLDYVKLWMVDLVPQGQTGKLIFLSTDGSCLEYGFYFFSPMQVRMVFVPTHLTATAHVYFSFPSFFLFLISHFVCFIFADLMLFISITFCILILIHTHICTPTFSHSLPLSPFSQTWQTLLRNKYLSSKCLSQVHIKPGNSNF